MKTKNLFKGEDFNLNYFTVKGKDKDVFKYFALDGINQFSLILTNLDFAYSYPKSRRDLWEKDLANLKSDDNYYSGIYQVRLGFRTVQELCEVYSWFLRLGKHHVEPDGIFWNSEGSRRKHQWSFKGIQKRKWFLMSDIQKGKDLAYNNSDLGNKEYWWFHVDSDYPVCPRLYSSCWAGNLYIHVPIKYIASYEFRNHMSTLKKDLGYKCGWKAPIEIRSDNGYNKQKYSCEELII